MQRKKRYLELDTEKWKTAIQHYPYTNAVLVRRHGLYVWGETWEKAKTMAECYDYLFDVATQMTRFNLDPTKVPDDKHGAFEN
ncbi:putative methylthioribulose-1-phosphate dehydratase [Armadillidium vulgare]|nr:putative methylthioribulose-1-phosphate dehydratase [Armadillidium vulgare]